MNFFTNNSKCVAFIYKLYFCSVTFICFSILYFSIKTKSWFQYITTNQNIFHATLWWNNCIHPSLKKLKWQGSLRFPAYNFISIRNIVMQKDGYQHGKACNCPNLCQFCTLFDYMLICSATSITLSHQQKNHFKLMLCNKTLHQKVSGILVGIPVSKDNKYVWVYGKCVQNEKK